LQFLVQVPSLQNDLIPNIPTFDQDIFLMVVTAVFDIMPSFKSTLKKTIPVPLE
jgi:hypothetical protein